MAAEPECFGLKGVMIVHIQMPSQVCVGRTDLTKAVDDIKEQWDCYNMMRPPTPLDTAIVTVFAVMALCDNLMYAYLLILHPDMDDIVFASMKVLVMKYCCTYVKYSQSPEPPHPKGMPGLCKI